MAVTRGNGPSSAFSLLLADHPLPAWIYDLETLRILEVNDAAVACYGYPRARFLALTTDELGPVPERGRLARGGAASSTPAGLAVPGPAVPGPLVSRPVVSGRHVRADGTEIEVEVTSSVLEWQDRIAALVVVHDVTEVRRLELELARRALYDPSTGLANAALFVDRVSEARSRRDGARLGVVVVGLDELDAVRENAGEQAAQAAVREIAGRLGACSQRCAALAYLGAGRFALLCVAGEDHEVLLVAGDVVRAVAGEIAVAPRRHLSLRASVGVALSATASADAATLLADATSAMRHAVERGDGQFVLADVELRRAAVENFETSQALASAARLDQLRLHYQPIVSLERGDVVACEALLRWDRPGVGLVTPDRFVPLAERDGAIVDIGTWVLDNAIGEAAGWPARAGRRPMVAVNLAARQLHDDRLVERFAAACDASGLALSAVCAELTESAVVGDGDDRALGVLEDLHDAGVEIAIDDFGAGYSSLAYLKHLPADVLKIDRSFVAGLGADRTDTLLVRAAVNVANGIGFRVVAEGVETETQLDIVRELGCDDAQGFLLAPPARPADLPAAMERAAAAASV